MTYASPFPGVPYSRTTGRNDVKKIKHTYHITYDKNLSRKHNPLFFFNKQCKIHLNTVLIHGKVYNRTVKKKKKKKKELRLQRLRN